MSDHDTLGEVVDARDLGAFIPAALDDYPLDPYEFRVYARIVRRASGKANHRGHDESVPAIAAAIACSERQVRYALQLLEQAGLIARTPRPGTTDRFDLTPSSSWIAASELAPLRAKVRAKKKRAATPAPSAPRHHVQDTPARGAGHPGTRCNPPLHEVQDTLAPGADEGSPKGSPVRASQKDLNPLPPDGGDLLDLGDGDTVDLGDADASFAAWWSRYPRQRGTNRPGGGASRTKTERRWRRMTPTQRRAAFDALPHYAADLAITGAPVAHAVTWLNQDRWETYADPPDLTLDEVTAALVTVCGGDPAQIADGARVELARIAHGLPADTTPDDVEAVATTWRQQWPNADPSPLGIVRHWHRFAARATGTRGATGPLCGACGQAKDGHDAALCEILRRAS